MADGARPFLMFQGGAAGTALDFYAATLPDARIADRVLTETGTIRLATLMVGGLAIAITDSPIEHDFSFTPSLAFLLPVRDDRTMDRIAAALGDGGEVMMPPGDYGFCPRYAFVKDRFGVGWHLHVGEMAWP